MRKALLAILIVIGIVLCYLTIHSAIRVLHADYKLSQAMQHNTKQGYRFVLITQELETPFWNEVGRSAKARAEQLGASLEVWGSYGKNEEDFLKSIEIAIDSKVDGIIVQGLDTPKFRELAKIKAAFNGIPIITVANDVPMNDSLRKTYVGSNQYRAGTMIALQLIKDMGENGKVIILSDSKQEYYQQQRVSGIRDTLSFYKGITMIFKQSVDQNEQIAATTKQMLNENPDVDALIAVNANFAGTMVQEIGRRSQVEPYYIYSFDDGADSLTLLQSHKLDGIIRQSPTLMGQVSVHMMVEWLNGTTVPLETNGYLTDIDMLKAGDPIE